MDDDDRDDADLRDRVARLEDTLDRLRTELDTDTTRRGRRPGPLDWVRRATAEVGIPATVAALETNIRLLESLQRGLRRDEADTRARRDATRVRETSFDAIDRALGEIQAALEGGRYPGQPEAHRLVREARRLNAEIRDRADAATSGGDPPDADAGGDAVSIDVEAELDAIRDDVADKDADR